MKMDMLTKNQTASKIENTGQPVKQRIPMDINHNQNSVLQNRFGVIINNNFTHITPRVYNEKVQVII